LKLLTSGQNTIQVSATDYKIFIRELNKVDRTLSLELKKEYRKIAAAGQTSVKKEIQTMGKKGPFAGSTRKSTGKPANGMAHGGRTGWGTDYGSAGGPLSGKKRFPYDSVLIETYTRAQKKGTGIARLRVRSAATVITDLARSFRGSGKTRAYPIRLFGGPVIMRSHTKTWKGVAYFIRGLGSISKSSLKGKSRNVYPGFDKSYPAMRKEVELVIQKTVRIVDENIDRNTK
jgi:hypothetical protein